MKANKAAPTGEEENSTVFADVEPMVLEGASVRVYDCAGQVTNVLTRRGGGGRSEGCPVFKLLKRFTTWNLSTCFTACLLYTIHVSTGRLHGAAADVLDATICLRAGV